MKEAMVQKIIALYREKEKYGKLTDGSGIAAKRKEPQCPYRLMNILFSDRFTKEFTPIANVADQVGLDTGKVPNNQLFWEGVQESFAGQDEAAYNMHFALMVGKSFDKYRRVELQSISLPLVILHFQTPTHPNSMNILMGGKTFGVQASLGFHCGCRSTRRCLHGKY